ncbi:hypothetical protein D3C87_1900230 [compost metagenome]
MVFFGEASRRELALNPETQAAMLASGTPLPAYAPGVVARPPVMDAQHLAEVHQAIDAIWEDFYSKVGEAGDAQA